MKIIPVLIFILSVFVLSGCNAHNSKDKYLSNKALCEKIRTKPSFNIWMKSWKAELAKRGGASVCHSAN